MTPEETKKAVIEGFKAGLYAHAISLNGQLLVGIERTPYREIAESLDNWKDVDKYYKWHIESITRGLINAN